MIFLGWCTRTSRGFRIASAAAFVCFFLLFASDITEYRACKLDDTMRAELIGHFEACMTEIYLHIDARIFIESVLLLYQM